MKDNNRKLIRNRRSFLRSNLAAGAAIAGASVAGEQTLFAHANATGEQPQFAHGGRLTKGDVAVLRFVAAAELIETDLWVQYAELGGVTTEPVNTYQLAFQNLDGDAQQYITSNTLDELSHAEFLNAYLISKGEEPVDF